MDPSLGPVAILLIALLFLLQRRKRSRTPPEVQPAPEPQLVPVPESVARERAAALLPMTGSRDATSLLVVPQVPTNAENDETGPDTKSCWVLRIELRHPSMLTKSDLAEVFPREFFQQHRCTLFGRASGQWTYVFAGGAPALFDALALEIELVPHGEEKRTARSRDELEAILDAARQRLATVGTAEFVPSMGLDDAAARGAELAALLEACDRDVILVLRAPRWKEFHGADIWDAMLSLGLEWGNYDVFHWQNRTSAGHEVWFSVWTTTPPGYFLPEQIAAGRVEVRDLVFGYSIPRSAAPVAMVDQLLAAARWTQLRLDGDLRFFDYEVDEEMMREYAAAVDARLREAGFPPGSNAALRFF